MGNWKSVCYSVYTAQGRQSRLLGNPSSGWVCLMGRWLFSFQLQVCLFLHFPTLLPLSRLMQQTGFFSPALVKIDSTGPYGIHLGAFFFLITITQKLLYCGSASEKMCCSHCCEVQKSCTRLLCRVLVARVVHGGGSTHRSGWLADWSVQLHCQSESSCWLYNFPTFICAQSNKRPAQIYTTQCGWDLGSSTMLSPYIYALHFQALWSFDSENYINSSSYKK